MQSIKFFIAATPDWAAEIIPTMLARRSFQTGLRSQGCEKTIYLPATQKFSSATELFIRRSALDSDITVIATRQRKGKKPIRQGYSVNEDVMEVMIELGRSRLSRKMLPAFKRQYQIHRGYLQERPVTIECEAITEAPSGMCGSYITLASESRGAGVIPWLKSQLVQFVGARQVHFVQESFEEMMKRLDPRFPWTYGQSVSHGRSLVAVR